MPYKITHESSDGGIITTYSGVVTDEEFMACTKEKFHIGEKFLSNKEINSYRYSISDFSAVTDFKVSVDTVKNNASRSKAVMSVNDIGLMAVVAPNDLEFAMGRLWQAYASSQGDRIKIFKSREEADIWVCENKKDIIRPNT